MDNTNKIILWVAGAVVFIAGLGTLAFYVSSGRLTGEGNMPLPNPSLSIGLERDSLGRIMTTSANYQEGERLRRAGDVPAALASFETALSETANPFEESQVRFKIAETIYKDDPVRAIQLFKEIVANPQYGNFIKASAIDFIGDIYRTNAKEELLYEIFKGAPYEVFLKDSNENVDLAFISLYEYGSNFAPNGQTAMHLVDLYINELRRMLGEDKTVFATIPLDEEKWTEYTSKIKGNIAIADQEIARRKQLDRVDERVATLLNQRAVAIGKIDSLRRRDPSLFFGTLTDAEGWFKEAIAYASKHGLVNAEGFATYNYAVFLERQYGQNGQRHEDIKMLLRHFYADDRFYKNTTLLNYMRRSPTDDASHIYGAMRFQSMDRLAAIDPEFKEFLNENGWNFK